MCLIIGFCSPWHLEFKEGLDQYLLSKDPVPWAPKWFTGRGFYHYTCFYPCTRFDRNPEPAPSPDSCLSFSSLKQKQRKPPRKATLSNPRTLQGWDTRAEAGAWPGQVIKTQKRGNGVRCRCSSVQDHRFDPSTEAGRHYTGGDLEKLFCVWSYLVSRNKITARHSGTYL